MTARILAGAAVALALLATDAATAAPGTSAEGGSRCQVQGSAIAGIAHSRVLAAGSGTVVYRVRGASDDVWWACRRGGTTRARLGSTDSYQQGGSEYGPTHTLGRLTVAGGWVLAVKTSGLAGYESCTKYAGYPCRRPTKALVVVDVRGSWLGPAAITRFSTGTSISEGSGPYANLTSVVLSSAGGLAWLTSSDAGTPSEPPPFLKLYGCGLTDAPSGPSCTPKQLDESPAIKDSLQLDGTTLSWSVGDQPQSAVLR